MKMLFLIGGLLIPCMMQAAVCTDGSVPGKVDSHYCCKGPYTDGYVDGRQEWQEFAPSLCGCPDGGTLVYEDYDNRVCCKNNLRYDYWKLGEEYFYKLNSHGQPMPKEMRHTDDYSLLDPEHCGCPDELKLSRGRRYCCRNGYAVLGNKESYEPEECGCPDGGKFEIPKDGGMACIKNNYMYDYDAKKYALVYPERWGCPQGSEKKGPVCCKGGYAYSNHTFKFDKVDGYCGCPDGGKPSEHYLQDNYQHPCCKGKYMYNPKTKRYDRKNKLACDIKGAQKMAESYARSLEKYAHEPGLEPLAKAGAENPELMREMREIGQFYSDVPDMY